MTEFLSIQIVIIAVASIAAQWTAWRFHIPAIIFLLGLGFILGPVSGLVKPDLLMGELLSPAISAAVAIILFEGSLQLHLKELRETRRAVRHVLLLGGPIGWILISAAAHYIAGLEWPVAITLGGMLVVTGPTVIMPLLRQSRLNPRVGTVLKWEGIVNDPLGVIFAILSYEYFVAARDGHAGTAFFVEHGLTLLAISLVSFALAHLVKRIFERGHMPEYLKTPFLFSMVLTLFFGCNLLLHESGLIAVTILGITLSNIHTASLEEIKRFKETITLMLVSGVFILLTADLDASVLLKLNWQGFLFIAALLFVIRPLTFLICSLGTHMTRQEILLAGFIAPRGVVCAAMAGVLGPRLTEAGFEGGDKILPIAFAVVIITVVLHSLTIKPLARRLKLTSEETNGVIIAGAYPWSIQLAETLKTRGVPVMLVDNDWSTLGKARLADIPVYYGELLSDETEFALEFSKYNTLLAATPNPAYNALICEKFGYEYGTERVFRISPDNTEMSERRKISTAIQGKSFISTETTLHKIWSKYHENWRFRTTRVGKPEKEAPLLVPEENENRMLVGVISKAGLVSFYSQDTNLRAKPKEDEFMIVMERDENGNGKNNGAA
ncbi:MAG: sodium:proton antiporter [Alphaproteobacteria bacterium]|nr:sodium:proton antiporter [Alphaproteobacteria bacterium]